MRPPLLATCPPTPPSPHNISSPHIHEIPNPNTAITASRSKPALLQGHNTEHKASVPLEMRNSHSTLFLPYFNQRCIASAEGRNSSKFSAREGGNPPPLPRKTVHTFWRPLPKNTPHTQVPAISCRPTHNVAAF